MIRWCTVPEIWCATDGQTDGRTSGRTDGRKKWHIEVGAPPENNKAPLNCGCIFNILKNCIYESTETSNFPDFLKTANITPVFKKDDALDKLNYGLVSILPLLSKLYTKLIKNYINLRKIHWTLLFVVFGKRIVHIIHHLSYYSHGKRK